MSFLLLLKCLVIAAGVLTGIALLTIIFVYAIAFFQYLIER